MSVNIPPTKNQTEDADAGLGNVPANKNHSEDGDHDVLAPNFELETSERWDCPFGAIGTERPQATRLGNRDFEKKKTLNFIDVFGNCSHPETEVVSMNCCPGKKAIVICAYCFTTFCGKDCYNGTVKATSGGDYKVSTAESDKDARSTLSNYSSLNSERGSLDIACRLQVNPHYAASDSDEGVGTDTEPAGLSGDFHRLDTADKDMNKNNDDEPEPLQPLQ